MAGRRAVDRAEIQDPTTQQEQRCPVAAAGRYQLPKTNDECAGENRGKQQAGRGETAGRREQEFPDLRIAKAEENRCVGEVGLAGQMDWSQVDLKGIERA